MGADGLFERIALVIGVGIRVPRYIPPEEDFWKVYAVASDREQAMLTCFLNLAAREGELLRLTWDEVDFARNTVEIGRAHV